MAHNHKVAGSSPAPATKFKHYNLRISEVFSLVWYDETMNLPQKFADVKAAREIAHDLYPNESIHMIEHSADNIVALIGTSYAVRFPRNESAYLRGVYEKHILKQLEDLGTIALPQTLDEHANPPYTVTSHLPGHHISSAHIRTFSEEQQLEFSKLVAQFAHTMHATLALNKELPLRQELGLDELADNEPYPIYYKRVINDSTFPTTIQDNLAKKCYGEWLTLCNTAPTVVVHDDLHTENMMFEDNHLVGILDFGDTTVGTPEQELRQLYRISEKVALAGAQEYQRLSGIQLDIEAIKLWAIMKELADYSKAVVAKNTTHRKFKRASRNLNTWLPGGDWGKGYDLSPDGYQ